MLNAHTFLWVISMKNDKVPYSELKIGIIKELYKQNLISKQEMLEAIKIIEKKRRM